MFCLDLYSKMVYKELNIIKKSDIISDYLVLSEILEKGDFGNTLAVISKKTQQKHALKSLEINRKAKKEIHYSFKAKLVSDFVVEFIDCYHDFSLNRYCIVMEQ